MSVTTAPKPAQRLIGSLSDVAGQPPTPTIFVKSDTVELGGSGDWQGALSSRGTFVLERDGAGLAAAASSPLSASTDRAGVDGRGSEPDGAAGRLFQNGAAPGFAMPGGVGRYSADAEGSSGTDGSGDDFV